MGSFQCMVLATVPSLLLVLGHQASDPLMGAEHGQRQQGVEAHHARGNVLHDKDNIGNKEHIMEHLDGVINKPPEEIPEEEMHFHYFQLHDYDKNNKLDGLELISALTHHHSGDAKDSPDITTEEELRQMVDTILEEDDKNGDGYIDYSEFVMTGKA